MKSGLLSNATKVSRYFSLAPTSTRFIANSAVAAPTGRAADPNVHGGETMTQGIDTQNGQTGGYSTNQTHHEDTTETTDKTYVLPNPPNPSSPKLENIPVNKPINSLFQQQRRSSDVGCVGFDGSPWPDEEDGRDIKKQREEQQTDDQEYFKHHKASPLSEIEVADTRKPLTKVTDGYFGDEKVITFRPEQIDTVEDSLLRAARIWREAKERGVPDWPHSRRLRELRGEDW